MAIGTKLNVAGKYITYVYSIIGVIVAIAAAIAGAQSAKENKRRESLGYFGLSILVGLIVFLNVFIARKMYGGRFLLGAGFLR